jgi:hypothetical protein
MDDEDDEEGHNLDAYWGPTDEMALNCADKLRYIPYAIHQCICLGRRAHRHRRKAVARRTEDPRKGL